MPPEENGNGPAPPAMWWYWDDWLKDTGLRSCSLAARGLWADMLAYMRKGRPYGYLTKPNGQQITPTELARMVGDSPPSVSRLLRELDDAGVPSKTADGTYFSRRMLCDHDARKVYLATQAEKGRAGAAVRWGKGK